MDDGLHITEGQLRDLVYSVRQLGKCGIRRGDIKYWNTTLQPAGSAGDAARLVLIDLGSVAPDYDGDAKALSALLLWCLEHTPTLRANADAGTRVQAAAAALDKEDFDAALEAFSGGVV
jgi:hypothetical protein